MVSQKEKIRCLYLFLVIFMYLGVTTAINIDCDGKPFHCINSTHFMICVDLGGGISKTVDNYVIQCPSTTVCRKSNHFECEYQTPTTTVSTIRMGDETNEFETNLQVTTVSPFPKSNMNTLSVTTQVDFVTKTNKEQQNTNRKSFTNEVSLPDVLTTKTFEMENLLTNTQKANLLNSNDSYGLLKLSKDEELLQTFTTSEISTQSAPKAPKFMLDEISPSDIISTTDIFHNEDINNTDISDVLDRNSSQFSTSSDILLLDTTTKSFSLQNVSNNFSERVPNSNIINTVPAVSNSSYLMTSSDGIVKINASYESTTELKKTRHDEILKSTQLSSQDLSINKILSEDVHQITKTNSYYLTNSTRINNLTSELYLTESNIQLTEAEHNVNTDKRIEITTSTNNKNTINVIDLFKRNNSLFATLTDVSLLETTTDLIGKNLSYNISDYVSNSNIVNTKPTLSTLSYLITSTDGINKINTPFVSSTEAKKTARDEVVISTQLSSPDLSIDKISSEIVRQVTPTSSYLNTSKIKKFTSELYVTEPNIQETDNARTLSFDNKIENNTSVSRHLYNENIINNSEILEVNNYHFMTDTSFLDTTVESLINLSNDEFPEYVANSDIVKTTPTISSLFNFMATTTTTGTTTKTNTSFESSTEAIKSTRDEIMQVSPQDLVINKNKTSPEDVHEIITNFNYLNTSLLVKNMTSELFVTESNIQVTKAEQKLNTYNSRKINTSIYNEGSINNTDLLHRNNSLFATFTNKSFLDTKTDSIGKNLYNDVFEHDASSNIINNTPKISTLSYLMATTESIFKINTSLESATETKKTIHDVITLSAQLLSQDLSINKTLSEGVNDITTTNYNYLNTSIIKNMTTPELYVTESDTPEMKAILTLSLDNKIENTQKASLQDMLPLKSDVIINTTLLLEPQYIFNNSRPTSKTIKNSTISANETESSTNINIKNNQGFISEFEIITELPIDFPISSISPETNSQTTEKFEVLTNTQKVYLTSNSVTNKITLPVSNNLPSSTEPISKTTTTMNGDSKHVIYSDNVFTDLLTTTKSLNRTFMDSITETWKTSRDAVISSSLYTRLSSDLFSTVSTIPEKNGNIITENYYSLDAYAKTERSDLDASSGTKILETASEVKKSERKQVEEKETERTLNSGNTKEINTLLQNQNVSNWIFLNPTMKPDLLNISSATSVNSVTVLDKPAMELTQNSKFLKQVMGNNTVLNNDSTYTHMFLNESKSATDNIPNVPGTLLDSRLLINDRIVIKTSNNIQKFNMTAKQIAFEIDTPGYNYLLNNVTDTINSSKLPGELPPLLGSGNAIINNKQNDITTEITSTFNDSLYNDNYNTSKHLLGTLDTVSISDYIIKTTKKTIINVEPVTLPKNTEDNLKKATTTAINDAIQRQPGGTIPHMEVFNMSVADTISNTDNDSSSVIEPNLDTVTLEYDYVTKSKLSEIIEAKPNQSFINTENNIIKIKTRSSGTIDAKNVDLNPSPQNEIPHSISKKGGLLPEVSIISGTSNQVQIPVTLSFQHLTTEEGVNSMDQNIDQALKVITKKKKHTPQSTKNEMVFEGDLKNNFYSDKPTEFVSESFVSKFITEPYISNTISESPTIDGTLKYGPNDKIITSINEDIGIDRSKAINEDFTKNERWKTQTSLVLEVSEEKQSNKATEGNAKYSTINLITETLTRLPNWNKNTRNPTSMRQNIQPNNTINANINKQQIIINNLTKVKTTVTEPTASEPSTNSFTSESHLNGTFYYDGQQNTKSVTKKSIKVENTTYGVLSKEKPSDKTINNVFSEILTTKMTPTLGDIIKLDQYSTERQNITRTIIPRELNVFSNLSNYYMLNQSSNSFTIGTLNAKKYHQSLSDAVLDSSTISMLHKEKRFSIAIFNATNEKLATISDVKSTHATKINLVENIDKSPNNPNISSDFLKPTKPHEVFLYLSGTTTPIAAEVQSLNLSEIAHNNNALNNSRDITDMKVNISKSDLNKSDTMAKNTTNVEKSEDDFESNSSTQLFNSKKDFFMTGQKLELKKDKENLNLNITGNKMLPKLFTTYVESPTKISDIESISITQVNVKNRDMSNTKKLQVNDSEVKGEQSVGWNKKIFVIPTRPAIPNNSEINKTLLKRSTPALLNIAKRKSIDIVGQRNNNTFTCLNRLRGRYADKNDCRKFYICIGKIQHIQGECPMHTVFSEIKKQCTKNLSHCIINNQFHCIQEGRFSDVLNSNIYYICVKNKKSYLRFKLQCQGGYHLNKRSVRCVKDQVSQQQKSSMSIDSESNKASDQSTRERKATEQKKTEMDAEKYICKHEGKFPDPDDCRRYFVCSKKSKSVFRRRTKKCDSDEVFHGEKKKCVSDESYECK